jgi:hypothetical protein
MNRWGGGHTMAAEHATFARELGGIQKGDPVTGSEIQDSQNTKYTHIYTHTHTHNLHKDQSTYQSARKLAEKWRRHGWRCVLHDA